MRIAEQVLGTPDIGVDLEARRDDHASEVFHVAHMAHARDMLARETSKSLPVLEVVQHYRPVQRASRDAERVEYLHAVGD